MSVKKFVYLNFGGLDQRLWVRRMKAKWKNMQNRRQTVDIKDEEDLYVLLPASKHISRSNRKMHHFPRPNRTLLFSILLVAFGTSLPFGFNLGFVNLTQEIFEDFINGSNYREHGSFYSKSSQASIWSFIVASFNLGGALGGLFCPFVSERLGRKNSLLLSSVISIIGTIMMSVSKISHSFELFTVGRTLAGFSSGFGSSLLGLYLSEIAPQSLRGFSGGFQEMFIVFGKLVGEVLSLPWLLGTENLWPYLICVAIIPSLLQICVLPFLPESPKHLRAQEMNGKTRIESQDVIMPSRQAIAFYHGVPPRSSHADHALMEIDKELSMVTHQVGLRQALRHNVFKQCLIMGIVVRLAQELTGITAIFNFSTGIFKTLDFSTNFSMYNSIGIAFMSAIVTVVAVFLVEGLGRRPLLVWGLIGTCICDIVFMCATLGINYTGATWLGYVCVAVLYIHVFIFSCGPGPVGWLIVPELTPQVARSTVVSAGVFVNWASNLLVTAAFLPLKEIINYYSFLMFIVPLSLCCIFLYLRLPETVNRPIDEIASSLLPKKKRHLAKAIDVVDLTHINHAFNSDKDILNE